MRIFNKLGHTCYYPYAGSGRRGVNLKTQEQSPDLPIERVNHPSLQSDLRRGRIGVLLTPADKSALRGLVDAEMMAMLEGAKKPSKPEAPAAPLGKQMDARPPKVAEETAEKPDASYEASLKEGRVDPVKEELKAKTDMMSEEGKNETLDKLAKSDQPSVAKAAEELKNDETEMADDQSGPESEDSDAAPEPGADAGPAEADGDETDGDDSGGTSDDAGGSDGDVVEPLADAGDPPKQYKGIAKPKLLSMCMERELDARPDMKVKELRALLVEDDAKKSEG
jgi:hypothetical protein